MIVTLRPCAVCREPFTPVKRSRDHWSETCGKRRCRSLLGVRREGWRAGLARAAETKRRQYLGRIERLAAERFGVLTDRERDIFAMAEQHGYDRGYNARAPKLRRSA